MYANILAMGATTTGTTAAADGTTSFLPTLIIFGAIILIFYFLIIRPQKKKEKEEKEMLAAMKKGDKIVTIGGIRGTVAVVKETTVIIKVDDNTRIEFSKNAISAILDKKPEKKAAETVEKPVEKVEKPAAEEPQAEESKL
ncbi:MAG: preprotein translocase subunit YajC [Spirochaetales bacterium]|nr:preprotein translocase subunit YajC [Spirochaetales bacterium]